jgi:hypothetical protein
MNKKAEYKILGSSFLKRSINSKDSGLLPVQWIEIYAYLQSSVQRLP